MTKKREESSQEIRKTVGKKQMTTLVQRPHTGLDHKQCSNCYRVQFWRQNKVHLMCLSAQHRPGNLSVKSCISAPQKLCMNSPQKTPRSFAPYSAGEHSVCHRSWPGRHLRFFWCQLKTKYSISSLSLELRVCTNLFTRGAAVYALFQHLERVFCQTSWGVLKLSPETGNRPQLPRLFMQSIFWHSCRTHRACCRLDEWFWEQQPPITMLLEIFLALSLLPYKSLNLTDYNTAALFV